MKGEYTKIAVLSDIHGDLGFISLIEEYLREADYVLLSGDITHFGKTPEIKKIIDTLKMFNRQIFAIPGNCDFAEVNQYLVEEDHSLDCRCKKINNIFFMGVGGSLPCPGKTPLEYSEEEFATMLQETNIENKENTYPTILLMHQPPFNTMNDQLSDGFHVGSHSVRYFIEKYQPLFCFCGHIHEGIGIDKIGKTLVINPGPLRMGKIALASFNNEETMAEIINILER